jgi:hypothetical protein
MERTIVKQLELIYYFTYFSPSAQDNRRTEETTTPIRPVENVVNDERPIGKKHTTVGWDDGGKIDRIIN